MTVLTTALRTPVGNVTVAVTDEEIVGCWFGDPTKLLDRLLPLGDTRAVNDLGELAAAVSSYFEGDLDAIDGLPVTQPGSRFKQEVWNAMRAVPAGTTVTYTELATKAGFPRAARAAGTTCATNLVAVIVPCHRIVPAGGGLGGYAYGVSVKRWLLDHEAGASLL